MLTLSLKRLLADKSIDRWTFLNRKVHANNRVFIGLTNIRDVTETENVQTADKQWKRSVLSLDLNEEGKSTELYQT